MRTYYRGPDAVVTSTVFAGRTPYAIRDLRDVHITRTQRNQPSPALLAIGLLVIAATAWPMAEASPLYAVALMVAGLPTLATVVVIWRLRPQTWELRAGYRGTEVTLYSSTDERVFNQVTRALRRAIEDACPPATWTDLAVA